MSCCAHCGLEASTLLACSGCHRVSYCGKECQRKDWKSHKKECRASAKNKSGAPSPVKEMLNWSLYMLLLPPPEDDEEEVEQTNYCLPTGHRDLSALPLQWNELDQFVFEDEADAALALMRAQGLYDVVCSQDDPSTSSNELIIPATYLLLGRSLLYLARASHASGFLSLPHHREEVQLPPGQSVAAMFRHCTTKAMDDPDIKGLAFTILARVLTGHGLQRLESNAKSNATNYSPDNLMRSVRMKAEAYLLSAEVDVMLSELDAAMGAPDAETGWIPEGRRGPWDLMSHVGYEAYSSGEHLGWKVSVPGYTHKDQADPIKTHLADYWWGQSEKTALSILHNDLNPALRWIPKYGQARDAVFQKRSWKRQLKLEEDLFRRGAAALASLDRVAVGRDKRLLVEHFRCLYPGTPFQPTVEFVRSLLRHPHERQEEVWIVSGMLGILGAPNRTFITITDDTPNSRWAEHILYTKVLDGEIETEHNYPTGERLYQALLLTMAGAGSEERSNSGPPRRPHAVLLSYRFRSAFSELAALLQTIDVECHDETAASLRRACAMIGTDFETGQTL
jgi:hypothetical protein